MLFFEMLYATLFIVND